MTVRVIQGDALERLRQLPDNSVHCCVSSPPYWGLRDYGVEGQIGLEPTPDAWAARLVEVFREVKRVLRPDGTCFVNVGDGYCANVGAGFQPTGGRQRGTLGHKNPFQHPTKPKDLIGQPWLLAFALRADGWWLRAEIIWSKPNPMPESVTDRPTKAHEQIFLLTKSARYFYDADAVREAAEYGYQNGRSWISGTENGDGHRSGGTGSSVRNPETGRNARSVWTIASEPFPDAHFATFPTEIPRRCILAGTSAKGCCPACGAPWVRVVEVGERVGQSRGGNYAGVPKTDGTKVMLGGYQAGMYYERYDRGWRPSCTCTAGPPVPAVVLDSFAGSGTVGLVAEELDRDAILIELSTDYCDMIHRRLDRQKSRRALGKFDKIEPMPGQLGLDL